MARGQDVLRGYELRLMHLLSTKRSRDYSIGRSLRYLLWQVNGIEAKVGGTVLLGRLMLEA